jgi:hypothetical protein
MELMKKLEKIEVIDESKEKSDFNLLIDELKVVNDYLKQDNMCKERVISDIRENLRFSEEEHKKERNILNNKNNELTSKVLEQNDKILDLESLFKKTTSPDD